MITPPLYPLPWLDGKTSRRDRVWRHDPQGEFIPDPCRCWLVGLEWDYRTRSWVYSKVVYSTDTFPELNSASNIEKWLNLNVVDGKIRTIHRNAEGWTIFENGELFRRLVWTHDPDVLPEYWEQPQDWLTTAQKTARDSQKRRERKAALRAKAKLKSKK